MTVLAHKACCGDGNIIVVVMNGAGFSEFKLLVANCCSPESERGCYCYSDSADSQSVVIIGNSQVVSFTFTELSSEWQVELGWKRLRGQFRCIS